MEDAEDDEGIVFVSGLITLCSSRSASVHSPLSPLLDACAGPIGSLITQNLPYPTDADIPNQEINRSARA